MGIDMKYTKEYWDWNNSQDDLLIKRKTENELIAEFMGMKYSDKRSFNDGEWTHSIKSLSKFETSWDWLMPVVKKCLVGEAEQSEEMSNNTIKNVYEGICNQDISFVYKSVIEFINQHNKK